MNNDLISRSALKEEIIKLQKAEQNITPLAISISFDNVKTLIDNAPTVTVDNYAMGYQDGVRKVLSERPKGNQAERALAIIDRLRTDGHINNKEQGTLRRAILLPEMEGGAE